jgi:hypothetical protein
MYKIIFGIYENFEKLRFVKIKEKGRTKLEAIEMN